MKRLRRRRPFPAMAAAALLLRPPPLALSQPAAADCDPCASEEEGAVFKSRPGTACKEYVQCTDGKNTGDFECTGDTIFDESKGYCNWPSGVTCAETTCPPTRMPSTDRPTDVAGDCPNPCPQGFTGFETRPGTRCQEYVSCENGNVAEELECFGDTLFNKEARYCDWPSSYACEPVDCPEREPTFSPTPAPMESEEEVVVVVPDIDESADCPNPCPQGYTGFTTRPGTRCKKYTSCDEGEIVVEMECFGDTVYSADVGYCDWASSTPCGPTPCPEREPTISPSSEPTVTPPLVAGATPPAAAEIGITVSPVPVVNIPVGTPPPFEDCPNPCAGVDSGQLAGPGTNCREFYDCLNGEVVGQVACDADLAFVQEAGACVPVGVGTSYPDWSCPPPDPCPYNSPRPTTESPAATSGVTLQPRTTPSPTTAPPTVRPTPRPTKTARPTTPRPTSAPTSTYQQFRSYLEEREGGLNSTVFQSDREGDTTRGPSAAYTYPDFMDGLYISVFQLPQDKAFFIGEGMDGRLPKLSGVEYGLVNLAAFLSNAMEEGIRIDSCDEWNTDFMYDGLREKYPLSNACGQYGRSYEDEYCPVDEPYQCAVDATMEVIAVDGNGDLKIPPLACAAREFDGGAEIFPGYYDSVDDAVIPSAYANTLGRTDIEGCCWWGRGALLTRGKCIIGKLDKYIGQGAIDRGIYVYPDINFCSNPEAVCNHERSNELRWVLGMLEWSDRVQQYEDLDTGWNYMDQLEKFVDDGMGDDSFIEAVVNIITRNCHDDSCADRWNLDEENNVFEAVRRDNFRRIILEVFNLPMTYRPTASPHGSPTFSPTLMPTESLPPTRKATAAPTDKPTRQRKHKDKQKANAETPSPSSAKSGRTGCRWILLAMLSFLSSLPWI